MSKKKLRSKASEIQSQEAKRNGGKVSKKSTAAKAQSIANSKIELTKKAASKLQSDKAKSSNGEIKKGSIIAEFQSIVDSEK